MPSPKASGRSSLKIFNAHMDPVEATRAAEYRGHAWTLSATRVSASQFNLYIHDEIKQGGFLLGSAIDLGPLEARLAALEADSPDDFVVASALNGTNFDITLNNSTVLSTDVSGLLDNVNVVPAVYVLDGTTATLPLTNGTNLVLDTTALASDTELATAIANLDAEEFVAAITVSAAGVATFTTNLGRVSGQLDVADIIEDLESKLLQPTLVGTIVTYPLQGGVSYTLDLATLNETFTNNGDGSITIDDGEGGTYTVFTDTDDQVVMSGDGSIGVAITTQADGQIDYNITTNASRIPATDPTGLNGNRIQTVLNNIFSDLNSRMLVVESSLPDDYLASANLSGNTLNLVMSNGSSIPVNLAALNLADVHVVQGSYSFIPGTETAVLPLTNGANLNVDGSLFATDNDLAAAIAALPPEEFVNSIVLSPTGVATFLTNQGTTAGTMDIAPIIANLESKLEQPVLAGTMVTFPLQGGTSYTLDLSTLNETFTDNGDGSITIDDGEGGTFVLFTDTDDQALSSSDGSIDVVPTTQPGGQVDYNARTNASLIPATDPTGNGANRVQGVLNNLHSNLDSRVAAIEAQMPDDHVIGAVVSGTNLSLQKSDGSSIVVSLGAFANNPDVQAVDGSYPFNATSQQAAISMSDGGQVVLDASVFATDNDLATALANLPAEEHLESLNTVGNITTFVSNTGSTIGTLDLSAYVNGADHFLQQPTLVGSVLTFPISNGVNYALSLAALVASVDEDITDNGDGTYTFTDGDGTQTVIATNFDIDPLPNHNLWAVGDTFVKENLAGTDQEANFDAYMRSYVTQNPIFGNNRVESLTSNNQTIAFADGTVVGETVELQVSAGTGVELALTGAFAGTIRNSQHAITGENSASVAWILRSHEGALLRWDGARWVVHAYNKRMLNKPSWPPYVEDLNGKFKYSGAVSAIPVGGSLPILFPVAATDTLYIPLFQEALNTGVSGAAYTAISLTTAGVSVYNNGPNLSGVRFSISNIAFNYAALGGIASF